MSLARTLRVAVVAAVKPEKLPLQPHEYFVLSRIEGRPTVGEIIGVSGLGAAQTEEILEKLIGLGALERVDVSPTRTRKSTQELRAQAQDRRLRTLQQQLGSHARQPNPRPTTERRPVESAPPEPSEEPEEESPAPPLIPPVSADDPRLDPSLGLTVDEQRSLLAIEDRRDDLTPFELLGLHPTHDLKLIRAGFRDMSRRLHPDAYHGRTLGRFAAVLSSLFAEAKAAHGDLQREEVRAPFVAVIEAEREQQARLRQQREAARQAAEELRARREQDQRAKRRQSRETLRTKRQHERASAAARAKVDEFVHAAEEAERQENFASAANNFRLALQLSPDDEELRARWEGARAVARRHRAKDAYARACSYVELGHQASAVPLFLEAADADPTLEHLARAADEAREQEPERARDLAMAALRSLAEREKSETPLRPSKVVGLRLMIARAFLAAGLGESAREQALLVQRQRPKDPEVRALLKSIKVT